MDTKMGQDTQDIQNAQDTQSTQRKKAHLDLAMSWDPASPTSFPDARFSYEPLLGKHLPFEDFPKYLGVSCFKKTMDAPIWVSSMTGGAQSARHINRNLALAVKEFGLGMGLGSCRPLLDSDHY